MQPDHPPARRRAARASESGFIISIELLLFFTIVCIGSIAGCVAIRDALTERAAVKAALSFYIHDSADPRHLVGQPRDFNTCGVPRVFARDPLDNAGLLLGVRPYAFESRGRMYFSGCDCTTFDGSSLPGGGPGGGASQYPAPFNGGGPWLASPTNDLLTGPNDILPISFLEALQTRSFAVGPELDEDGNAVATMPGYLYRVVGDDLPETRVRSMFVSQAMTDAIPDDTIPTTEIPDPETACGVFEHDDDFFEAAGAIITPSAGTAGGGISGADTSAVGRCFNLDPVCVPPEITAGAGTIVITGTPPCGGINSPYIHPVTGQPVCAHCVPASGTVGVTCFLGGGDSGSGVDIPEGYLRELVEVPGLGTTDNMLSGYTLPFVVDLPVAPTRTYFAPGETESDHPALDALP